MISGSKTGSASLYDLKFAQLEAEIGSPVHARTLWRSLYRHPQGEHAGFQRPLREWLSNRKSSSFPLAVAQGDAIHSSDALTRRFLVTLQDGKKVETVLMGYPGRFTACLSTQAGCAMGCVFCATGQLGFERHLSTGEIVAQAVHCQRVLSLEGGRLRNLVIMGMGEPLHNYDNTMTALEIITDTRGLNLGPSRITVSTVGVVPGIERWIRERQPYNLAVSLHAADANEREALIPSARKWPLESLIAVCKSYCDTLQRRIFFEWTLIDGRNDCPATAEKLVNLLRGLDAHVNLIPLNRTSGFSGKASAGNSATRFKEILKQAGIPSTIRQRRGIDVEAGCGQLRAAKSDRHPA